MDELRAIKKQSTAYLPVAHWVKSGVLPFLVSLSLHLGVAGGAGLMLYKTYDLSGGGNTEASKPVYVTLVQETSARANIPETAKPLKVEKSQTEEQLEIETKKDRIVPDIKKRTRQADKKNPAPPQSAAKTQAPSGASGVQTLYSGGSGRAEVRYQDQVRAAIHANRIYPRQARRLKMEGESVVRLEVMRDGHIKSYSFVKSTGHHVLDRAVEEIIQSSDPLPNVPASIQKVPVIINLPLGFKLQQ